MKTPTLTVPSCFSRSAMSRIVLTIGLLATMWTYGAADEPDLKFAAAKQEFYKHFTRSGPRPTAHAPADQIRAIQAMQAFPKKEAVDLLIKFAVFDKPPEVYMAARKAIQKMAQDPATAKAMLTDIKVNLKRKMPANPKKVKGLLPVDIVPVLLQGVATTSDPESQNDLLKTLDEFLESVNGTLLLPINVIDDFALQGDEAAYQGIALLSRSKMFEKKFGYQRCVVQAMSKLKHKDAITFLIKMIPRSEGLIQYDIIYYLTKLTNQKFREDETRWTRWWTKASTSFKFPEELPVVSDEPLVGVTDGAPRPAADDPVASDPVVSDPVVSDPATEKPPISKPPTSVPVAKEPAASEPETFDSAEEAVAALLAGKTKPNAAPKPGDAARKADDAARKPMPHEKDQQPQRAQKQQPRNNNQQQRNNNQWNGQQPTYYGMQIRARRIVFVLDTSGSMDGPPITIAKKELLKVISELPEATSFDVVMFDGSITSWQPRLVPATKENKALASAAVRNREVGSDTFSFAALKEAFRLEPEAIYFLSDGEPSDAPVETILNHIVHGNIERRVSIHTIGVKPNEATRAVAPLAALLGVGSSGDGLTEFMKPLAEKNYGSFRMAGKR
jgi:hypothetical protein